MPVRSDPRDHGPGRACYTLTMAQRYDSGGRLGKARRTPQGGVVVPAFLTRSGLFEYQNPDGSKRIEYRADAEVFAPESLASLAEATITNLHPDGMVTSSNWRSLAVGHASAATVKKDGDKVAADLVIQDAETITLIEDGVRNEVSCGYTCELDSTPGLTPGGDRYDARQLKVRYNHLALVPMGRAGREVSLRLDSAGDQIPTNPPKAPTTMKIEIIDGIEYEAGTSAHTAAVQRRDAAHGQEVARVAKLESDLASLQTRVDAAESVDIGSAVQVRLQLIERARKLGCEGIEATMTPEDITAAMGAKVLPGVDLATRSPEFIEGALAYAETVREGRPAPESEGNSSEVRADVETVRRSDGRVSPFRSESELSPAEKAHRNQHKTARSAGTIEQEIR